jgi:hypothetical protein
VNRRTKEESFGAIRTRHIESDLDV